MCHCRVRGFRRCHVWSGVLPSWQCAACVSIIAYSSTMTWVIVSSMLRCKQKLSLSVWRVGQAWPRGLCARRVGVEVSCDNDVPFCPQILRYLAQLPQLPRSVIPMCCAVCAEGVVRVEEEQAFVIIASTSWPQLDAVEVASAAEGHEDVLAAAAPLGKVRRTRCPNRVKPVITQQSSEQLLQKSAIVALTCPSATD